MKFFKKTRNLVWFIYTFCAVILAFVLGKFAVNFDWLFWSISAFIVMFVGYIPLKRSFAADGEIREQIENKTMSYKESTEYFKDYYLTFDFLKDNYKNLKNIFYELKNKITFLKIFKLVFLSLVVLCNFISLILFYIGLALFIFSILFAILS